ncbi:MAG: hypothetical protein M1819_002187 [Sarea resinae]|nr:MAG: hypothetical protein M1819_002187 [Sarea resinae]
MGDSLSGEYSTEGQSDREEIVSHLGSPATLDACSRSSPATSMTPTSPVDDDDPQASVLCNCHGRATHQDKLDGERSLLDLGNYIPVGSLRMRWQGDTPARGSWKEVTDWSYLVLDNQETLRQSVMKLARAGWIRAFCRRASAFQSDVAVTVRIWILPDDVGRGILQRSDRSLRRCLKALLCEVDVCKSSWAATYSETYAPKHIIDETDDKSLSSLYYLYNTMPSPKPDPHWVHDRFVQAAMSDLLDGDGFIDGLKTSLYPYQCRSAALMLQKESMPKFQLDPRLHPTISANGSVYYFDYQSGDILREPRLYEEVRGGILAETMGLGKTLICLATILASKGYWPRIPIEHSEDLTPVRERVGSLQDMAASAIGRHSVPWKTHFERLSSFGDDYSQCIERIKKNVGSYMIRPPQATLRKSRATVATHGRRIRLCTSTLIIVPPNLLQQWKNEIYKHTEDGALRVLVMDSPKKGLPPSEELAEYDVVLFSRTRFEREIRDGEDAKGRRAPLGKQLKCFCPYIPGTREKDCDCFRPEEVYNSPLKELHWLRLIVDEGHNFASSGSKSHAVLVAADLQTDSRWIISGTPTKGLIGVEVELAANEHSKPDHEQSSNEVTNLSPARRKATLELRNNSDAWRQERSDVEKLGRLAIDFFKISPWVSSRRDGAPPAWNTYMYQSYRDTKDHGFKGYSACLKRTLEGLIIRHSPEDVEADLKLPPLYNQLIHLEPSFYDRLSINLFVLVLTSNAITSERRDEDYLFHPKNKKSLNQLIANLRQSGFYWTGFSRNDVEAALQISKDYLAKESTKLDMHDRQALEDIIVVGDLVLDSSGWNAFSRFHELGIFLQHWPGGNAQEWALDGKGMADPLLMGMTQLCSAQNYVNNQLYASDPSDGLAKEGWSAMYAANHQASTERVVKGTKMKGVPKSSLAQEPTDTHRKMSTGTLEGIKSHQESSHGKGLSNGDLSSSQNLKSALKRSRPPGPEALIPADSPVGQTIICGTASAKLSYLIDKILSLHKQEKILVFYEGDNVAWYIAQALDLLHIKHLIYAKSLKSERRSQYVVTFNTTETFRVLLMDVHQASHGLNMSSASRVFFVNAIWQPNVEAQAIKRAHRIGQARPVYVETLILKGTLEEKMLQRRKAMSTVEHQNAEKSLLDDKPMTSIIQSAKLLPVSPEDMEGPRQMASLHTPQQVFGRPNRNGALIDDPDADLIDIHGESPPTRKKRAKATRTLDFDQTLGSESRPMETNNDERTLSDSDNIIYIPPPARTKSSADKGKKKVARFAVLDPDPMELDAGNQPAAESSRGPSWGTF